MIKTVYKQAQNGNNVSFDREVNEAINEGYTLKEFRLIVPTIPDRYNMLFALLEKEEPKND